MMIDGEKAFTATERVMRQRTAAIARSAVNSSFGSTVDWDFDQDRSGAVVATGPHGLFRDGLRFPAGVSEARARSTVKEAQIWIHEQQNNPPDL